jgi:hypothetical protein
MAIPRWGEHPIAMGMLTESFYGVGKINGEIEAGLPHEIL